MRATFILWSWTSSVVAHSIPLGHSPQFETEMSLLGKLRVPPSGITLKGSLKPLLLNPIDDANINYRMRIIGMRFNLVGDSSKVLGCVPNSLEKAHWKTRLRAP